MSTLRNPVVALGGVEAISDQGTDCDSGDFESPMLEVDLYGLMLGICAVGVEFHAASGFADIALEGHLVV